MCYLVSYLRKHGFHVDFVNSFGSERDRLAVLLHGSPRTVAITSTFYVDSEQLVEVVEYVRERSPKSTIVGGGPHVFNLSSDYDEPTQDELFAAMGADAYILDSQGEGSLRLLLSQLRDGSSVSAVSNLAYRTAKGFQRTPRRPESNGLAEEMIDWSSFPVDFLRPTVYLRTARSCPFSCAFCNYPAMAGAHTVLDLESLTEELHQLHELGVQNLVFIDDTFNVPLPRFKKLLWRMIENGWNFRWMSFFRCSNADDEAFWLMRKAGCVAVFLGIESGDQGILDNMRKFAKLDRYAWEMKKLREHGILTFAGFIVGFPGETAESARNTISFIEAIRPDFYTPNLYFHDVRAPISDRAGEFAIRGAGYSWAHDTMDWKTLGDLLPHAERSHTPTDPALRLRGASSPAGRLG